jgi:hypothetical protein
VAVQVTVVIPSGNKDPDAGAHVTGTLAPYSSVAVGAVQDSVAPDEFVAVPTMSEGTLFISGNTVPASTVTVNDALAVFP